MYFIVDMRSTLACEANLGCLAPPGKILLSHADILKMNEAV